ncbi:MULTISPECIES: ankyrin repeat domain-containing protein [Kocuria]|uniref:Ankyrin repeat domain-containing protein n=1 Tax=Kocuria subflava TaxID=1736139 RepID=A0A846TWR1_9MICC|nr:MULTISPECIES: ankyrin repeat domain-containing protein [Kocuria]NKE09667.1 ankyrin repeat domain-containing protein [Kocuria subflava]
MTQPPELSPQELELLQSMFDAARDGRTQYLASAVDQGVPVNLTNSKGDTLLNLASYHEHPETVAALLERGADTERVSDMGFTALICAVFRGNQAITQMLLEAGARQDTGHHHAQAVAREFGRTAVLELLEAND